MTPAIPSRPRTVGALATGIESVPGAATIVHAAPARPVRGISDDSREAGEGVVFFARAGSTADGASFARAALAAGACLVVSHEPVAADVPTLLVSDVDAALRAAADAWYGRPQDALDLVGITGTKGKTTTTYLVRAALAAAGRKTAVLGTIAYDVGDGVPRDASNTTPGALALRRLLAEARDAGATACVMEVSSHALDQGRTAGLSFRAAVLSNLASDHLDYHQTPEAYFEAKARLFEGLAPASTAVVNRDDPSWGRFAAKTRCRVLTYGTVPACDLRATRIELAADGTTFRSASAARPRSSSRRRSSAATTCRTSSPRSARRRRSASTRSSRPRARRASRASAGASSASSPPATSTSSSTTRTPRTRCGRSWSS